MSDTSSGLTRWYPWIGVTVFGLAAFLIYRTLRRHSLGEIGQSLNAISSTHLALGAAFTAGSYLCLTAADTLAIRYTKGDLPYRRIALASLISLSIVHTLGLAAFSSGAVRIDAIILEARGGDRLRRFRMREDRLMAEALE